MSMQNFVAYPKKILKFSAIWPEKKPSFSYNLRTLFTLSTIFLLMICLTYNAAFHLNSFVKLSESLYMLISIVNTLLKVVMLSSNGQVFMDLMAMMEMPSFTKYSVQYSEVVTQFKRLLKIVENVYWVQVNSTILFLSLFPSKYRVSYMVIREIPFF